MRHFARFWILLLAVEMFVLWIVDRTRHHGPPEPVPFLIPVIDTLSASPSSIVLTSSDPDTAVTATGSVVARVAFASLGKAWDIKVQASSTSLTNCSSVPASAITVSCSSVGTSGGLLFGPNGSCRPSFTLSTIPTTLASGTQGDGGLILFPDHYTIQTTFSFADGWQYAGASSPACGVTLVYTINASY